MKTKVSDEMFLGYETRTMYGSRTNSYKNFVATRQANEVDVWHEIRTHLDSSDEVHGCESMVLYRQMRHPDMEPGNNWDRGGWCTRLRFTHFKDALAFVLMQDTFTIVEGLTEQ